ncbi:hypothetical protein CRH09_30750 [Nocardia terpenica]|uniref:Lsr2 dimerization domain-containing protein n=2 Tax=Nocardia terpenica TaxID=455432 RepID=A0A291RYB0_9NOCA|nr:hypothetical protein CRH09_30750 [Nocardia terpenica]
MNPLVREGIDTTKRAVVSLVDDRDGVSLAEETVEFGLDGITYETNLTVGNARELRNTVAHWAQHARKISAYN